MAKVASTPKSKAKHGDTQASTVETKAVEPGNVEPAPTSPKVKPKAKRNSKAKRAAKRTVKPASKRKAVPMAKTTTRKTNKSEKIRQALTANPQKSPAEIARKLKVNPALVYNVKASMANKAGKPNSKPGRKPGRKTSQNGAAHSGNGHLESALEFVSAVGGLQHAEQLIGTLRSIKERL